MTRDHDMSGRPVEIRAEWKTREFFAEVAEVLGIATSRVVAATNLGSIWVVMWAADDLVEPDIDSPIKACSMRRDGDGVLQVATVPREMGKLSDLLGKAERGELG